MSVGDNPGSSGEKREITIGLQYRSSVADIGPLITQFGEETPYLASQGGHRARGEDGDLKVSVQRTHEWEHEVVLAIIGGSTVFATALLTTLGKRTGDWIADQIKEKYQNRSRGGRETVVTIGLEDGETMEFTADELVHNDVLADVLKEANEKGSKVVIEFP